MVGMSGGHFAKHTDFPKCLSYVKYINMNVLSCLANNISVTVRGLQAHIWLVCRARLFLSLNK